MHNDVLALLNRLTQILCSFCEIIFPAMSKNWWNDCVCKKLSFSQIRSIRQRKITSLSGLDLAALLRVVDRNWYYIAEHKNLAKECHIYLQEMQALRNRWAHAGAEEFPQDDIYRDLDTLQRFAIVIEADIEFIQNVKNCKKRLLKLFEANINEENSQEQREKVNIKNDETSIANNNTSSVRNALSTGFNSKATLRENISPLIDAKRNPLRSSNYQESIVKSRHVGFDIKKKSPAKSPAIIDKAFQQQPREGDISRLKFESHLCIRLHQIYTVLYFLNLGLEFPEAIKEALRLFPNVKDPQTIYDACARRFSGHVETFTGWYSSGELLNKLDQKFSLSVHDYRIFKDLLSKVKTKNSSQELGEKRLPSGRDVILRRNNNVE